MELTFNQLRQLMPKLLLGKRRRSYEFMSAPGRGKSDFIEWLVGHMSERTGEEWGFSTAFLATYTPPDLIGYQMKGERTFGERTVTVTDPTMPLWMITEKGNPIWDYKHGILFLDEYGQGEADVKRASAQLLLKGEIGPWKLPPGWRVIAASNRAKDLSGVTKSFAFTINRRGEIHIKDDLDSWKAWALENDVSPLALYFASEYPHIVFNSEIPKELGPFCTPRSFVTMDQELRDLSDDDTLPDSPEAIALATGRIGAAAAQQFFVAVRLEKEMPKFEKILANPDKVAVPDKPDAKMLIAYNLAHRVTKENCEPVVEYMDRFPKEFGVTFAHAACKRTPTLLYAPPFQKWCRTNASLMAVLTR